MTTISQAEISAVSREQTRIAGSVRYDWLVVALSAWLVGGAYLDGWAHNHNVGVETFFTPWHAMLYSGFLACALCLLGASGVNVWRGAAWENALPAHYNLSLLGVLIFSLGGVGDLLWHSAFGIERGVEALLSPTHHLLAIGIALIVSGPWRAAWHGAEHKGATSLWPMVLSVLLTWSIITFIMQSLHPMVYPAGVTSIARVTPQNNFERDIFQVLGVGQIMLQAALLMGFVLLLARRWSAQLPLGAFTLMFTLNGALMATQKDEWRLLFAFALGGVVADMALRWLQPSQLNLRALRVFAFVVPLALFAFYFGVLALTDTIWWRAHSISGTIFAAGMIGFMLSYLICPPRMQLLDTDEHG